MIKTIAALAVFLFSQSPVLVHADAIPSVEGLPSLYRIAHCRITQAGHFVPAMSEVDVMLPSTDLSPGMSAAGYLMVTSLKDKPAELLGMPVNFTVGVDELRAQNSAAHFDFVLSSVTQTAIAHLAGEQGPLVVAYDCR